MQKEAQSSPMPGQGLVTLCILAPLGTCPSSYPQPSLGIYGLPGKGSVVLTHNTQK